MSAATPLMAQYYKVKKDNPDTILLFRIGDFFETFDEDAKTASRVLGITLTKRSNGAAGDVPLAGFPHHAIDTYLPKLVRNGYRVAICEQVEDPKKAKGIVKREVIEVVTPGVVFSDKFLDHKKNNYLLSVYFKDQTAGFSFSDISTGEFFAYETPLTSFKDQLDMIAPAEVIICKRQKDQFYELTGSGTTGYRVSKAEDWIYNYDYAREVLTAHFNTVNLKGFGIEGLNAGLIAAGAVLHYLQETQKSTLPHLRSISIYNRSDYMYLDPSTRRNLEITFSMNDGGKDGSLFEILDKTSTPMGGRMLKKWIIAPLKKITAIRARQNAVEELFRHKDKRNSLRDSLSGIGDLERLISRICTGRANPREISALRFSLEKIPGINTVIDQLGNETLSALNRGLSSLTEVSGKIKEALVDTPPMNLAEGGIIRAGYSIELDELRDLQFNAKEWLSNLQIRERERTGITSLKISYNRVFGYYIEITNAHKDKIPDDYIRKQTLVNAERFITPDLKDFEEKILHAEEKIYELESQLFNDLRLFVAGFIDQIQNTARNIAMLDCLLSLADCAADYGYSRPEINEETKIEITEGRHPVVERILPPGEKFTPNDIFLDNQSNQIIILTGPNMAGKSVFLRQAGLLVLLAQIGSFIPAKRAVIGVVDRIFTRVGASDNITAGESTFLVEMQEAANILNNATSQSLILLDEIGRGTSTFDGISIAWSITEYLHQNPQTSAKTIFATHYHELNELSELYPRITNYRVMVREIEDKVIFLHKVTPGKADHSYGIQVAQMAGLPKFVTDRAKEILLNLESKELTPADKKLARKKKDEEVFQYNLFEVVDDKIRKELEEINTNELTPIQALNKLDELKKRLKD